MVLARLYLADATLSAALHSYRLRVLRYRNHPLA